jgi:hypothetical protein
MYTWLSNSYNRLIEFRILVFMNEYEYAVYVGKTGKLMDRSIGVTFSVLSYYSTIFSLLMRNVRVGGLE